MKSRGDKYIIDRDERECGGNLVRVATFDDWKTAKKAWDATPKHEDRNITMFFGRLTGGTEHNCETLDCK